MAKTMLIGAEELIKHLNNATKLELAKKIVKKNTVEMQAKVEENTRISRYTQGYATGDTHDSVGLEIKNAGLTGVVGVGMDYDAYLETGTRFMAAQPSVKPAFEEQRIKFKSDLEEAVR